MTKGKRVNLPQCSDYHLIECVYGFVAEEIPEQQQIVSKAIHTAASSRGEFPSSRNGSTAIMPARLVSSSTELQSEAVVKYA